MYLTNNKAQGQGRCTLHVGSPLGVRKKMGVYKNSEVKGVFEGST